MKLRVRGLESKQTIRIEIPDDSSFHHLTHSIAQAIRFPSPSSLRLSLNRTHHISPSSPDDSLLSLGIAAGDLLFYSVVDDGASTPQSVPAALEVPTPTQVISLNPINSVSGKFEEQENDVLDEEAMEIGEEFDRFLPESCFVRRLVRVLSDGFGENDLEQKLIITAVHSVFVESGFVLVSDEKLRFPSSMALAMSLRYSLPEIISASREAPPEIESVVLKFQTVKTFVNVYGNLTKPSPGSTFRICLDSLRFAPVISSLRSTDAATSGEGLEREVFELWKMVRDGLAMPLKIDLCSRAGLAGPACFARLPAELLTRILELLPGDDVARAGSACRELAYLARDDGLWRRKFEEEFGGAAPAARRPKSAFEEQWQWRRRVAEEHEEWRRGERRVPHCIWGPSFGVGPVPVFPFGAPRIGGDYDRLPGFFPPPFGGGGRRRDPRWLFSPDCNLGGGGGF